MAKFHGETFERTSKESRSGDSPYHIFTPDDTQLQDDTAAAPTFTTFQPRKVQYLEPSTTADSFTTSLTLDRRVNTNTEESFYSNLPRHGSHGSSTSTPSASMSYRNRSVDNITANLVKSLPPRGKYHLQKACTTPGFKMNLPPRQTHQAGSVAVTERSSMSTFPRQRSATTEEGNFSGNSRHDLMPTSQRKPTNSSSYDQTERHDIDYPSTFDHLSQECYNRLQSKDRNAFHRNVAYEGVVRRSSNEVEGNFPMFGIQVKQQQDINDDLGTLSTPVHGSGTNLFEMCSDDDSKTDLSQIKGQNGQHTNKTSSTQAHNDYENVKEYIATNNCDECTTTTQVELKWSRGLNMEGRDISGDDQREKEIQQWEIEDRSTDQQKPDYENVKKFSQRFNTDVDDNHEWIPLEAASEAVPHSDMKLNESLGWGPQETVPQIVVEAEHNGENRNSTEDNNGQQSEENIASLGKDLRKSADLETLSDYEEMASSFSSHYTAIKSNQQQPFQFLSSTELEVAPETEQQSDDDKQPAESANPVGDTQQSKQTSASPKSNRSPVPKKKKAKVFQFCLIFITLAIAIAALVLSTLVYLKLETNCTTCTTNNTTDPPNEDNM